MSRVEGESIFLSRVDGRGSHVEGRESKVQDRGSYLLLNLDFFSEDIFFFAGQSSSVDMFLPDLINVR